MHPFLPSYMLKSHRFKGTHIKKIQGKKNPALYWMCSPLVLFHFLNNTEAYNICTGLGSKSDLDAKDDWNMYVSYMQISHYFAEVP